MSATEEMLRMTQRKIIYYACIIYIIKKKAQYFFPFFPCFSPSQSASSLSVHVCPLQLINLSLSLRTMPTEQSEEHTQSKLRRQLSQKQRPKARGESGKQWPIARIRDNRPPR